MQTRSKTREAKKRRMFEMKRLPDEIITAILMRLPVKSLVRFKSACTLWESLISDPNFTKSHCDLAAATSERLVLCASLDRGILSVDFNESLHDNSSAFQVKPPLGCPSPYFYRINQVIGSCRGFLLVDVFGLSPFCLWNPITCVLVTIPRSPVSSDFSTFLVGFGYDSSTDDYLMVEVVCPVDGKGNQVDLFSLKANSWMRIEDLALPYRQIGQKGTLTRRSGFFWNNAIHWLACWYKESEAVEEIEEQIAVYVILAFDVEKRIFSEFPLPIDYKYDDDQRHLLTTVRGDSSLGLYTVMGASLQMWVMEEYKVESSWTKTVVVSLNRIPATKPFTCPRISIGGRNTPPRNYGTFLSPICSTKTGDIVACDDGSALVKFNENGELQQKKVYDFDYHYWVAAWYTQSLVSLPLAQQDDEDEE